MHQIIDRNGTDNHERAGCQQGKYCTGPGCRIKTGKTARKRHNQTDQLL